MKRVREMVQALCSDPPPGLELRATAGGVEAVFEATERRQRVTIGIEGDQVALASVVLDRDAVTRSTTYWRELAVQAWERNRLTDLVLFGFDGDDNLVGRVNHPRATLDAPELRLYLQTLLEECDRFEYVLTGEDAAQR